MTRMIRAVERGIAAAALAVALAAFGPGPSLARQVVTAGDTARAPGFVKVVQGRPSASVIERARRSGGLPADARAIGWRLVDGGGGRVWKIIFRVGNRQVAVEVPAGG